MNDQYVRNVIEAALLAAGRPLAADELRGLFDERDGSSAEEVRAAIGALRADYETRGIELVEVASGFRIQIRAAVAQPVSRLWQERPQQVLARAARDPGAGRLPAADHARRDRADARRRGEPEHHQDAARAQLDPRGRTSRRARDSPELLGTTREFLDYFGLKKLDDLPTLAQLKALGEVSLQLTLPRSELERWPRPMPPVRAQAPTRRMRTRPADEDELSAAGRCLARARRRPAHRDD